MKYPLFKVFFSKDISRLLDEINIHHLYGKYLNQFQLKLKNYLKTDNIIPISDFDHAIHILIRSFNLKEGDSVILSPFCCRALILPFLINKIDILWADIDPNTGTIDPHTIISKLKANTKLIIHSHLGGIAGHVNDLNNICKEKGIFFVGDCSQSFLTNFEGKPLGIKNYDASIFSFQTVRIPSTIQGAALFFNDKEKFFKTLPLVDYGMNRLSKYLYGKNFKFANDKSKFGYGAVMSEMNALIGIKNFEHLENLNSKQTEVIKMMDRYFANKNDLHQVDCSNKNFKWVYGVRSSSKNELIEKFKSHNIEARPIHSINNPNDFKNLITGCLDYENDLKGFRKFIGEYFAIPCGWWLYNNFNFQELLELILES